MATINDLSLAEQIDIIICQFSGHEREEEIAAILSILTSYKITDEDYVKYYESLTHEEIEERINNGILDINSDDSWQKEQNAWNSIINCLGFETVIDIMDNWKKYVDRYIAIENLLHDIRETLYKDYLKF